MLAARYYGIGDIRVEETDMPACGPGQVLIRVSHAGICGSDLHIYREGMFVTSAPVTMGHEFSGVVAEIGDGVGTLSPGDYVVGDPRVSCGLCVWCRQGDFNLCPDLGFIGEVRPGCFARYIVMDQGKLIKLPAGVDLLRAALVEPLAVALHIARRGSFGRDDHLGIVGAGPIGLLTVLVAKAIYKVRTVSVIDLAPKRLDIARQLGADNLLDTFPPEQVSVAVEAVGLEATLAGALKWVEPAGRLVMAGLYEKKVLLDPNDAVCKELNIAGINAYNTAALHEAADLLGAGVIDPTPVVTHVMPLETAAGCFEMLAGDKREASKILLTP